LTDFADKGNQKLVKSQKKYEEESCLFLYFEFVLLYLRQFLFLLDLFVKLRKPIAGIKLYRKLRYRKGYGVHSPFVYSLITKVIEEKAAFYAFDEIEKLRQEMVSPAHPLSDLTVRETQSRNYGALLFRIVNFYKCRQILQIGSSTGIMSLYLAMASPKQCCCHALEERSGLLDTAQAFSRAHHLEKLDFREGDYGSELKRLQVSGFQADLIFINGLYNFLETENILSLCLPFLHKKTILIIDNIVKNKNRRDLWKKIKSHPQVRSSIDLCALGIAFFDDNLPKKQYKAYFDYGKKSNLHTKRRRRFHFLGRRKAGFKNRSSH
jgi:predicted O-methyltransferase YrrM